MALAQYFDKSALSAASVLRGFDYTAFRRALEAVTVGVYYDGAAAATREGQWTLELVVDLLARLYPTLAIHQLDGGAPASGAPPGAVDARLAARARAVNARISLVGVAEPAAVAVVVGRTPRHRGGPTIYVGSDGWTVRASASGPVGSGATDNPFGAGAAACVAAACVFTTVFAAQLPARATAPNPGDAPLTVSVLDWTRGGSHAGGQGAGRPASNPPLAATDIGDTRLVGVGAIGNAAVWALARTPRLSGTLHLVDDEVVDASNVQRYVLTTEATIGWPKVELGASAFAAAPADSGGGPGGAGPGDGLRVRPHAVTWAAHAASRGDYRFDRLLLALDTAEARIAAQASLPRWVANAWTQPENLGVSRHASFVGSGPCVACLYLPAGAQKSRDQLVGEAVRARGDAELMEIRALLQSGRPVGRGFMARVAERLGVPLEPLLPFEHESLASFYTRGLCGGVVLRLGGGVGPAREVQVPMAFQSALAGILLAAELLADAGGLRHLPLPARTELDLLSGLGVLTQRAHSPAAKHQSGRCICQDPVYQRAYIEKFPGADPARALRERAS